VELISQGYGMNGTNGGPALVRIEYEFDPESRNWHFTVPALGIVGGGCPSKDELFEHVRSAVRFALSDDQAPVDEPETPGVKHLAVSVSAA
jgi:hypothetical protein